MAEQLSREGSIKEIGGFELIGKIGQGGMGTVFKARQVSLDRIVALKILPPSIAKDAKFIERFQREARATAKLNHPNIVQGVDVGKDPKSGLWYFAMELVDGPSLLSLLKQQRVLPEERALQITRDIARALECAATHGFVHRDIKPDNILMTSRGEAKLADLGLAKQLHDDATLTQSGQAVGTPYYMAPEQVRGRGDLLDIRTDIYALGGTLFHLVTGRAPFTGETSAVIMSKHLTEPVPKAQKVNPAVSEACSRLIEQMMQKEREKRVQSPAALIEQVEKILSGETVPEATRSITSGPVSTRRKRETAKPATSLLPVAIVGGLVVAVGAALFVLKGSGEKPADKVASRESEKRVEPKATKVPDQPKPVPVVQSPKKSEPVAPKTTPPEPVQATKAPVEVKPEPVVEVRKPEPAKAETPKVEAVPEVAAAPTPAVAPAPAKTEPPAAKAKPWPLPEILSALRERSVKKAVDAVSSGEFTAKDELLDALKSMEMQREARLSGVERHVGQTVNLTTTTKGAQSGKLTAIKNGVLQLERAIIINGESRGTTQSTVPLDDITFASLEKLAPLPAPSKQPEFLAIALSSLAANQLDAADVAVAKLAEGESKNTLSAELKNIRTQERESAAQAAWAKIEARAAEAPSQTKAKQLLEEIAAFIKKHAESEFASTEAMTEKITELRERFERLSLGLDPRVLKLFKGRVLNYDAKTQVITLGYDLSTKEQTDDFIDSLWAPPGDQTGLTWRKGELRTFCKGTADRVFKMPQFLGGTLNIQLDCKKIDTSKRNRFEVEVSFYGLESTGKTPKLSFRASEKRNVLFSNNAEAKANEEEILFRNDGPLELICQGTQVSVKYAGKPIVEHTLAKPNDHAGFWIGGGWDSGITFSKIQVSGRLDPVWLSKALEAIPKK